MILTLFVKDPYRVVDRGPSRDHRRGVHPAHDRPRPPRPHRLGRRLHPGRTILGAITIFGMAFLAGALIGGVLAGAEQHHLPRAVRTLVSLRRRLRARSVHLFGELHVQPGADAQQPDRHPVDPRRLGLGVHRRRSGPKNWAALPACSRAMAWWLASPPRRHVSRTSPSAHVWRTTSPVSSMLVLAAAVMVEVGGSGFLDDDQEREGSVPGPPLAVRRDGCGSRPWRCRGSISTSAIWIASGRLPCAGYREAPPPEAVLMVGSARRR